MCRLIFPVVACAAVALRAGAQVPGRDLLALPIATVGEAAPIATQSGDGLWNPASIELRGGARARVSVAALSAPADQSVSAQLLSATVLVPGHLSVGLTVVRAAVGDLVRTESDPQSLGGIPYNTTLASILVAGRAEEHVAAGLAVRYRTGQMDGDRRSAIGLDGGVMADGLFEHDVRVGASTFLWQPAKDEHERTSLSAGADVRAMGTDSRSELRVGYAYTYTEGPSGEHYVLASGRSGVLTGRVGVARVINFGQTGWRTRLGLGLYYARYALGIAREDSNTGVAPTYQFTLSSTIK